MYAGKKIRMNTGITGHIIDEAQVRRRFQTHPTIKLFIVWNRKTRKTNVADQYTLLKENGDLLTIVGSSNSYFSVRMV